MVVAIGKLWRMIFIPIQTTFFSLRILRSALPGQSALTAVIAPTFALLAAGCASTDNLSGGAQARLHDSPADVAALRPRTPPTPTTAASPLTMPASAGGSCGLPDFESSFLTRINQYRAKGANCRTAGQFEPAQPLVWNVLLQQAAIGHSQEMAAKDYFSHTSLDGRTMLNRINATGYVWSSIGENIAASKSTVIAVVDGWMASDNHCANLMKAAFRDVALACVVSPASKYGAYWTMNVGTPR